MSIADKVKQSVSILDIAQRYGIEIKKTGERYSQAECIFCQKSGFKLWFYHDTNSFYCHRCKKGGDIFDLVAELEPCDFISALNILCKLSNIDISDKERRKFESGAAVWQIPSIYRFVLSRLSDVEYDKGSASDMAHKYLSSRGITNRDLIERYDIIYVDIKRNLLESILGGSSFRADAIANSGVLKMPNFFYEDSILVPVVIDRKVRQFMSISCGMEKARRDPKIMNMKSVDGLSPRRVWGIDFVHDVDANKTFICESVTDALSIMQQLKIPAVAIGSQFPSAVQEQDLGQFPQMTYYVLFDKSVDQLEPIAAQQLSTALNYPSFVVELPLKQPTTKSDPKDVNDLLQMSSNNSKLLVAYRSLTFSEQILKSIKAAEEAAIIPPIDLELHELLHAEHTGKRVRCKVLPFSDIIATHSAPVSVRATCTNIQNCPNSSKSRCPIARCGKRGKLLEIELDDPNILMFCHTKRDNDITMFWRRLTKSPCKGTTINITTERQASIHQIELGPNIDYLTGFEDRSRFTFQRAYISVVESDDIPDIEPIEVIGRVIAHPYKDHQITLLVTKFNKLEDAVSLFKITDSVKESLAKFQEMPVNDILDDIINYTGIIDEPDMHLAFLLTFHSVLHYHFLGADYLGCLQSLLLCDTSTGKSTIGRKLIDLFRLGERLVCETASRTGVTYSIQMPSGHIRWGAMVRNDRKFLMLDEFQAFPEGESKHLKEARSSGQLKVDRLRKGFAFTRNRLLIAANPKPRYHGASTQLFSFDYPVESIRTVFDTEADIRRLDIAIFVRGIDKTTEDLHQEISIDWDKAKLSSSDWRSSVRWAWQKGVEDVIIEDEAIKHLLKVRSPQLVDKYKFAEDIPLFTASNTKHSILKLCFALASLTKSTDKNFEKIIVKKKHVDFICDWLDYLYSSPSCKLDLYAAKRRKEFYMTEDEFETILSEMAEGEIGRHAGSIAVYMGMWNDHEVWSTQELRDMIDIRQDLIRRFNRICLESKLLTKRSTRLNKTPKMMEFIKKFHTMIDNRPQLGVATSDLVGPDFDIKEM